MNIINHKSINSINSSYFMYIAWFEDITMLSPAVHAMTPRHHHPMINRIKKIGLKFLLEF